jgi:CBS domain-containing protein
MPISGICARQVIVVRRDTPVQEAAQLMRQHHVGDVVVVDVPNGRQMPVGIVTDRDIVVEIVAMNLNPADFTIGDILTGHLETISEESEVFETIEKMRAKGVRRMPVVDAHGALTGIVSIDDLLHLLANEMADLATLILRERKHECEARR